MQQSESINSPATSSQSENKIFSPLNSSTSREDIKPTQRSLPYIKCFVYLPHTIEIRLQEKQEVVFEIEELKDVTHEVEVKVCLSFGYERSLNSEDKRSLVDSCQILVSPTQSVTRGRIRATFCNILQPKLCLKKGMKIGICRFHVGSIKKEAVPTDKEVTKQDTNVKHFEVSRNIAPSKDEVLPKYSKETEVTRENVLTTAIDV